jgi:hypothetical protein
MTAFNDGGTSHRGNKNKGSISTHVVHFAASDVTASRKVQLGGRHDKGGILMGIGISQVAAGTTTVITIEDDFDDSTLAVFTSVAADVPPLMFVSDTVEADAGAAVVDIGEGLYFRGGLDVELTLGDADQTVTLWVKR